MAHNKPRFLIFSALDMTSTLPTPSLQTRHGINFMLQQPDWSPHITLEPITAHSIPYALAQPQVSGMLFEKTHWYVVPKRR
jgi:hypothetical protein